MLLILLKFPVDGRNIRLNLDAVLSIGELNTYDKVIELETADGLLLKERSWEDFNEIRIKLKESWTSKDHESSE